MDYFSLPPVDLPITADPDVLIAQLLPVLQKRFGKRPAARSTGKSTMAPAEYSANSATEIMPRDVEVALERCERRSRKFSLAHTNDRLGAATSMRSAIRSISSATMAALAWQRALASRSACRWR